MTGWTGWSGGPRGGHKRVGRKPVRRKCLVCKESFIGDYPLCGYCGRCPRCKEKVTGAYLCGPCNGGAARDDLPPAA